MALYLDQSVPMDPEAKKAYIASTKSWFRQYMLPVLRPFCRLMTGLVQLLKFVLPKSLSNHRFLHQCISHGLNNFVSPEANFLILRHFHQGTNVIKFLCDNLELDHQLQIPLYPKDVFELSKNENMVVQHDINLYNFVIEANEKHGGPFTGPKNLKNINYDSVTPLDLKIEDMPQGRFNILDVESAIELIAPYFQLLTTDEEYWRASISLQLDETVGVYLANLLQAPERLFMVNNKHPMVPNNIVEAANRLIKHGLSTEMLYQYLLDQKAEKEA